MFKVGDKVRRKKEYRGTNSWDGGDKVFTISRVVNSSYRDVPNLYFRESGDNNWHAEKFELAGPVRNLPAWF